MGGLLVPMGGLLLSIGGLLLSIGRLPGWQRRWALMTTTETDPTGPAPLLASRALARRAGWGLVDQALSASTNVAVFLVVAREVDLRGLDAFASAFYVFTVLIGIERALVGQVFGVRFADVRGTAWRQAAGRGLGMVLAGSSAASALMVEDR